MSKTVKTSSIIKSPNYKTVWLQFLKKEVSESEVLLKGKVRNATVKYVN